MFVSRSPNLFGLRRAVKTMFSDCLLSKVPSPSSPMAQSGFVHEREGDLFRAPRSTSLAHCVSSDLRMGKGIAVYFKKKFGQVEELKRQKKCVGEVAYIKDGSRYIFYLVTKKNCYDKPTELTLRHSLLDMKDRCKEFGVKSLAMPRIGCGLDGLKWPAVFRMLCEIFSDVSIEITVYSIPDRKYGSPMSPRCLQKPLSFNDFTMTKSPFVQFKPPNQKTLSEIAEDESPKQFNLKNYSNVSEEESPNLFAGRKYSEFSEKRSGPMNEERTEHYSVSSEARIENVMALERRMCSGFSGNENETPKASKSKYSFNPEEEIKALRAAKREDHSDFSRQTIETPQNKERKEREIIRSLKSRISLIPEEEIKALRAGKREDNSGHSSDRTETPKKRERTETPKKDNSKNVSDYLEKTAERQARKKSKSHSNISDDEKRVSRKRKKSDSHSACSKDEKIARTRKKTLNDSDGSEEEESFSRKRKKSKSYSEASIEETAKPKRKKHRKHSDDSEEESDTPKKKHSKSSKKDRQKKKKCKNQTVSSKDEKISKKRKKDKKNSIKKYLFCALSKFKLGLFSNDVLDNTNKEYNESEKAEVEEKGPFHKESSGTPTIDHLNKSLVSEERFSRSSSAYVNKKDKWVFPCPELKPEMSVDSHQSSQSHKDSKSSQINVKRKFPTSTLVNIPKEIEDYQVSESCLQVKSISEQTHRRFRNEKDILIERKPLSKTCGIEDSSYLKPTLSSKFEFLSESQKTSVANQTLEVSSGESLSDEDHLPRRNFLLRTKPSINIEEESSFVSLRLDRSQESSVKNDYIDSSQQLSKECRSSNSLHKKGLSEILKRRLGAPVNDRNIGEARCDKYASKKGRNFIAYPVLNISKKVCKPPCIPVGSMYSDKEKASVSVKDRLSFGVRAK